MRQFPVYVSDWISDTQESGKVMVMPSRRPT